MPQIHKLLELVVLLIAILWPFYLLANRIDSDEIIKTVLASIGPLILYAYNAWKRESPTPPSDDDPYLPDHPPR